MKLDDFLKVKTVRCVKAYDDCLKIGKEYGVIDIRMEVKVKDDEGDNYYWESDHFEPVLDSAENPLQEIELTPEFEVAEPTFKVGDKVYVGLTGRIAQVTEIIDDDVVNVANKNNEVRAWVSNICHATTENYDRLQATFPRIKFEQPTKELKGSDLARAMLEKGWKYVPCYVHDGSDDEAIDRKHYVSVKNETPRSGYNFSGTGANDWKYAVPIDPRTGEPLTEAVLDE